MTDLLILAALGGICAVAFALGGLWCGATVALSILIITGDV